MKIYLKHFAVIGILLYICGVFVSGEWNIYESSDMVGRAVFLGFTAVSSLIIAFLRSKTI